MKTFFYIFLTLTMMTVAACDGSGGSRQDSLDGSAGAGGRAGSSSVGGSAGSAAGGSGSAGAPLKANGAGGAVAASGGSVGSGGEASGGKASGGKGGSVSGTGGSVGTGGSGSLGGSGSVGGSGGDGVGGAGGSAGHTAPAYMLPPKVTSYEILNTLMFSDGTTKDISCPNWNDTGRNLGNCQVQLTFDCSDPTNYPSCANLGLPDGNMTTFSGVVWGACVLWGIPDTFGMVDGNICCPGCWDGKTCHIFSTGTGGVSVGVCSKYNTM